MYHIKPNQIRTCLKLVQKFYIPNQLTSQFSNCWRSSIKGFPSSCQLCHENFPWILGCTGPSLGGSQPGKAIILFSQGKYHKKDASKSAGLARDEDSDQSIGPRSVLFKVLIRLDYRKYKGTCKYHLHKMQARQYHWTYWHRTRLHTRSTAPLCTQAQYPCLVEGFASG